MMPLKLLGVFALVLLAAGCERETVAPTPPFEPGQVWTYRTRPGEQASRVIVCRVEDNESLGPIVHIYVNGLRLKDKNAPGGVIDHVPHMAYASDALRRSVIKLESSGTMLPQFEERYHQWRTKFMQSRAGVWTSTVSESLQGMESAMSK